MTRNYKVAFLVPSLNSGGAEKVVINLANFFASNGHKVWIITSREGLYFDLVTSKVSILYLPNPTKSSLGFKLFKPLTQIIWLLYFLNKEQPDILMSTLISTNIIAPYAKLISWSKTKIVLRTANTFDRFRKSSLSTKEKLYIAGMKTSYALADALIANSEDTANDIKEFLSISHEKIKVIPNPVYSSDCQQLSLEKTGHQWVDSGENYILSVGRLHQQKGFDTLLKAFSLLDSKYLMKLIILGIGHEEEKLKNLAKELKISGRVDFPGFRKNPYPFIKKSRIFVLSSRWEGFGNVLVEALAMGTSIVSTDCPGGPRGILENGRYGTLVDVENPKAMAKAIELLLLGEIKYSQDSLIKQAKRFSIEEVGQKYFDYFLQVLRLRS